MLPERDLTKQIENKPEQAIALGRHLVLAPSGRADRLRRWTGAKGKEGNVRYTISSIKEPRVKVVIERTADGKWTYEVITELKKPKQRNKTQK
jgi:hypothetical protein